MARVKRSVHARKHHKAILEEAKGHYGDRSRTFRAANESVMHAKQYAFRDRRARKGEFRKLWIQRINAAARENNMSYSRLIAGLHAAGVEVDPDACRLFVGGGGGVRGVHARDDDCGGGVWRGGGGGMRRPSSLARAGTRPAALRAADSVSVSAGMP